MAHFKNWPEYPSNHLSNRYFPSREKNRGATLASFSPCRHDDEKIKQIRTKKSKNISFVVKSVLETKQKRFRHSPIREIINLKFDTQILKNEFSWRCNYIHKHNVKSKMEKNFKYIQFHSFMSERHLNTRSKTCMHHENFKFFLVSASEKHVFGTSKVTNEQLLLLAPLKKYKKQLLRRTV